jgi:hypothetical protein
VTLITGAGTLILGLSWLIGSSLAEVLTSIIFLFIKHPYDVGDRVDLPDGSYTVKEIQLLSTIFLDSNGALVHAPNTKINGEVRLSLLCKYSEAHPDKLHSSSSISDAALRCLRRLISMSLSILALKILSDCGNECWSFSTENAGTFSHRSTSLLLVGHISHLLVITT